MKSETESKLVILSEILFVLLPILIILIIHLLTSHSTSIFRSHELSYATIVLFGQTIVKFATGICKSKAKNRWQLVAFILTSIIILGLVPSIVILSLLLLINEPDIWILWAQLIFFIFSVCTTYIVGTVGQMFFTE